MQIRESTRQDTSVVREVYENAFGQPEGPIISELACEILDDITAAPTLSLVAEENNQIVGNILFSTVNIEGCDADVTAFILAPLAVVKDFQAKGIGKSLIQSGLRTLHERGAELVFVLGDPNYYSLSGFESAYKYNLEPPNQLECPEAWMVLQLRQGTLEKAEGIVRCCASLASPEHWSCS